LRARLRLLPATSPTGLAAASLLDAVFSVAPLAFPDDGVLRMPSAVERLWLERELPDHVTVHALADSASPGDTTHVVVTGDDGAVLGTLDGLRFATLEGEVRSSVPPQRLAHTLDWRPAELAAER
ncbi:hypothetical protein P8605_50255, partial [Streptomyces sp. T-3]|nr:hypothetical protein [Streptomyces sp. T-3]